MNKNKKKKRVYKYNVGGNTNKSKRQARRFNKKTSKKNKKSDGVSLEKTQDAMSKVSNVAGGLATLLHTAVAAKKHFSTGK